MTDYWSWCPIHKTTCLKRSECTPLERCVDRLESIGTSACQAYDYCPKREDCLAAARCLDARAGPPRRLNLKTTDIVKEYTNSSSLTHKPLAEIPEDREPETASHDSVNHPSHYTSHPSGIECIQITRWMNFNRGNAIKYIWRAEEHGAKKEIEDLKKARWYIDDEIKRLEAPSGKTEG